MTAAVARTCAVDRYARLALIHGFGLSVLVSLTIVPGELAASLNFLCAPSGQGPAGPGAEALGRPSRNPIYLHEMIKFDTFGVDGYISIHSMRLLP